MLISKATFNKYQQIFYSKVRQSPYTIGIELIEVLKRPNPNNEFSLEDFVGDNERKSTLHELPALYEKEISSRARDKFGLPKEVNGIIYLSPKQLIPIIGTFKLDWNKTKIHFEGSIQVIEKIVYLESMYNSCVGIQIFVKDALKGG